MRPGLWVPSLIGVPIGAAAMIATDHGHFVIGLLVMVGLLVASASTYAYIGWLERREGYRRTVLRSRYQQRVDGRWVDVS